MKLNEIINESLLKTVRKYDVYIPEEELKEGELYRFADEVITLYNKLSYEDDEDSEMDMIILKAIIDNLDDYYFDE